MFKTSVHFSLTQLEQFSALIALLIYNDDVVTVAGDISNCF